MLQRAINIIVKTGTIIIVTTASFVIKPPLLNYSEAPAVNYLNVIIFLIGISCIIIADKIKYIKKPLLIVIPAIIALVIFVVFYNWLYDVNSIACGDGRVVISNGAAMDTTEARHMANFKQISSTPLLDHLVSHHCQPLRIWPRKELTIIYYLFIIDYFLIAIAICFTIFPLIPLITKNDS